MDLILFAYCMVFLSFICHTSATTACEIKDREDCVYTVVCEHHPGSAPTFDCHYEAPYVTFIVTKSNTQTLTKAFFGSTNFDARVRIIKAIDNFWPIIGTNTFSFYSKSLMIDLSANSIKEIKGEAFNNLILLESLNLSRNEIDTLDRRAFFITDVRSSLRDLDLSHNMLTEIKNGVFTFAYQLKKLYLQNNRIVVISDMCFGNLNMTHLFLQHNRMPSINMSLINLKSLVELDISFNSITKVNGYEINRLRALEFVNMSNNAIEFIESNCFDQTFNLRSLDLSYNRIKAAVDTAMFANNNALNYLNLCRNNITVINEKAFSHTNLTYLNLEQNNITGEITTNTFIGLQNIETLDLSNQSITVIKNNSFNFDDMTYLNLSSNKINYIEDYSFSKVASMGILDISYNNLSNIKFLRNTLPNLTDLYINNNKLSVLPKSAFDNQGLLIKLDISGNIITTIDQYSLPLKSLQYLDVTGNRFIGTVQSNVFSPAKLLRSLDLSDLSITKIDKLAFVDMPVLVRLNISRNKIESIEDDNFQGMGNLYSLDVSYNEISRFQLSNNSATNCKALYLNNNKITDVSPTLFNMASLLYLHLSNNDISDLSALTFSKLVDLHALHLSNNKIKVFNNPETNSLQQLSDLSLSSNQLTDIDLSYFKNLEVVDLSNNKFSNINATFFINLENLKYLDVSFNKISQLTPGTFKDVKMLQLLNISHNQIPNLRYGSFNGLHRTKVLDLSYNQISVIDVDVFHECTELKQLVIDYNQIKTLDVERLIMIVPKLSSLSLGGNPVACREIVRNIKDLSRMIMLRQIDVTSIHKIYHEDNVHGIKCGDINSTATTQSSQNKESNVSHSTTHALLAWCSIITILIVVAAGAFYVYKRNKAFSFSRSSRIHLRESLDVTESQRENDFLGF